MNVLTSHRAKRIGMIVVAIACTLTLLGALDEVGQPGMGGGGTVAVAIWGTASFFAWRKVKRMKPSQVADPAIEQL